jgi:nucleoside-diphosphate-sugar epimerase
VSLETVVITGASGQVGTALLSVLQGKARTVALVRKHADVPASEVVTDWTRSPTARQMISCAGSIVHLAGNLKPEHGDYKAANEATTEALCSALRKGTSAQIIFLSFVGASESSSNAYLSTKARAERALRQAAPHVVVFRCTHIIGSPDRPGPTALSLLRRAAPKVTILGSGRQTVAPVFLGDVVSAIITALERGADGAFDLPGPESMSLDDLVRLLNRDQSVPIRHVPAPLARLLPFVVRDLPRALVDVMLGDCVGDPTQVRRELGLMLASLRQVWSPAG